MSEVWQIALGLLLAAAIIYAAQFVALGLLFGLLLIFRLFMRLGERMIVYRGQEGPS